MEKSKNKGTHIVKINHNGIQLDEFKLKSVQGYEIKSSAAGTTELTLKLTVKNSDIFLN